LEARLKADLKADLEADLKARLVLELFNINCWTVATALLTEQFAEFCRF
jgi:hypothetical protein